MDIIGACAHVCAQRSIKEVLPMMLPSSDGEFSSQVQKTSEAAVCELVLWAEEFGFCEDTIDLNEWPNLDGPFPRFETWSLRVQRPCTLSGRLSFCQAFSRQDGWQEDWADRDGVVFGRLTGGLRSTVVLPSETVADCWQEDWFQHQYLRACQLQIAEWLVWQHGYQQDTEYPEFAHYYDVPSYDGPQYAAAVA